VLRFEVSPHSWRYSLFGLAWGGFTYTTSEKASTSDRFMLLAKRPTTFRCLPSRAQATRRLMFEMNEVIASSSYARGNENNAYSADGVYYLGPGVSPGYAITNFRAHYDLSVISNWRFRSTTFSITNTIRRDGPMAGADQQMP